MLHSPVLRTHLGPDGPRWATHVVCHIAPFYSYCGRDLPVSTVSCNYHHDRKVAPTIIFVGEASCLDCVGNYHRDREVAPTIGFSNKCALIENFFDPTVLLIHNS